MTNIPTLNAADVMPSQGKDVVAWYKEGRTTEDCLYSLAAVLEQRDDLLEALRDLVNKADARYSAERYPVWDFKEGPMPQHKAPGYDKARAAIAKATGKEGA